MSGRITFITGNPSKAEQLAYHLQYPVQHKKLDLHEIQSVNLEEVVTAKAKTAYLLLKSTVLVEDTALSFQALHNLPGPLIKWFLQELGNDGLCNILSSSTTREAKAEVKFALYDGKKLSIFSGKMNGSIAQAPRGNSGFGWDSIFIPKGYTKTWGEMSSEEQAATSMRKIALKKLQHFLDKDK